jgi:hypothetical protein
VKSKVQLNEDQTLEEWIEDMRSSGITARAARIVAGMWAARTAIGMCKNKLNHQRWLVLADALEEQEGS